jgi:hypothetical protein
MAIVSHTIPGGGDKPAKIYAETANIQFFVGSSLEPDAQSGPTNVSVTFPGTSRQQYPGDPTPISTSGGTRVVLVDPSRKSGNAIPGKVFILAQYDEDKVLVEKRQFSYTGSWVKLHAFLRTECVGNVFAYNSSGARYTISEAAAP